MRPCAVTYALVGEFVSRLVSFWQPVVVPWRQCSEQQCRWWCLCCNKWLCWIVLIVVAILLVLLWVVLFVVTLVLVTICSGTGILVFLFTLVGNVGKFKLHCFAADLVPGPSPPQPSPATGTIPKPPDL